MKLVTGNEWGRTYKRKGDPMNYIKELRLKSKLTLSEVSILTRISRTSLYQIERGLKKPNIKQATKLTRVYNCHVSEITGG